MKKNVYAAPAVEFVSIEAEKDILSGSYEIDYADAERTSYGIGFWY